MISKIDKEQLKEIITWAYRLFVGGCAAGGIWAASVFATQDHVKEAVHPFAALPPRVDRLEELSRTREAQLIDIASWRRTKDEIDTRLAIILENQQKQMDRQQLLLDRQQVQIDDLRRQ